MIVDRPRSELQQHMLLPNLSLNITRQTKAEAWRHALVANSPTPAVYTEIKDGSSVFPLYLYPRPQDAVLIDVDEALNVANKRKPNISAPFIATISSQLTMQFVPDGKGDRQQTVGPEDIFTYMYAIFHSPTYRERYAEFLKIDFPRLPLTVNATLFRELCTIGARLVTLHLLEETGEGVASYPQKGNNVVDVVRYTEPGMDGEKGHVWINQEQYFEGIAPEVWEFHVGGYQVCQKWLKDRKGRMLSFEGIEHYEGIVASLEETIILMKQIDVLIDEHGGWL
jgi:predicted helicase